MLILVLFQGLHASGADTNTVDAPLANISLIRETLVIDYTNTIIYVLDSTQVLTVALVVENDQTVTTSITSISLIVTFVPTLLRIKRLLYVTPAPTGWLELPAPTRELRTVVFEPYYLCLCSFGLVFLGGGLWTYRFRKPVKVLAPVGAFNGNASSSSELDDIKGSRSGSARGSARGTSSGRSKRSGSKRSRA
jgi:hypothetical protein